MPILHAPPRAAYIHVPFCRHRCGYCNFTVITGRDDLIGAYVEAIERELSTHHTPRAVDTLFLGGGTPTLLPLTDLERLFKAVLHWFPPSESFEFTVEANPNDITPPLVALLADCGVNRLSLGAQSFHPQKLHTLERSHSAENVRSAVATARPLIAAISLDLIFAAPSETRRIWREDLQAAAALEPDHISTYGLTYEKGAAFWSQRENGNLSSVDEEVERAMYIEAIDFLQSQGFEHYEVSNFAQTGKRCRHNEVYWTGQGYFGVGPGAAKFVNGWRETNHRSVVTYIKRVLAGQSPVAESECLPPIEAARERFVFGLRRLEGVHCNTFQQETGFRVNEIGGKALENFIRWGFLEEKAGRIRLTREGLLVSDSLWSEVLSA